MPRLGAKIHGFRRFAALMKKNAPQKNVSTAAAHTRRAVQVGPSGPMSAAMIPSDRTLVSGWATVRPAIVPFCI